MCLHISSYRPKVPRGAVRRNSVQKYWFRLHENPNKHTLTDLRAKLSSTRSMGFRYPTFPGPEWQNYLLSFERRRFFPDTDHQFVDKVLKSFYSAFPHEQQRRGKKTLWATTNGKRRKKQPRRLKLGQNQQKHRRPSSLNPPVVSKTIFTISFPLTKLSMHLTIHVLCSLPSTLLQGLCSKPDENKFFGMHAWLDVLSSSSSEVFPPSKWCKSTSGF